MYYLLEDNRIIDSEEYFEYAYAHKNGKTYYNVAIKKQSENVYDLIDWEKDLVGINVCGELLIVNCKTARSEFSDGYYSFNWITAIYKQDEDGNYIKVWEKKDEKNEKGRF